MLFSLLPSSYITFLKASHRQSAPGVAPGLRSENVTFYMPESAKHHGGIYVMVRGNETSLRLVQKQNALSPISRRDAGASNVVSDVREKAEEPIFSSLLGV